MISVEAATPAGIGFVNSGLSIDAWAKNRFKSDLMFEIHCAYDSVGFLIEEINWWGDNLPPEKNIPQPKK